MSEQNTTPQEIDLIELFGNIWNWITKAFFSVLFFFLRNIIPFIVVAILGLASGFGTYKISTPYFESDLLGKSYTIGNIEVIQKINKWEYNKVFSDIELEGIKSISAKYLLDINQDGIWDEVEEGNVEEVKDTAIMNRRLYREFCIRVELNDTAFVKMDTIRDRVFRFLESNDRVHKLNKIRIQQKNALLPKLEKEMNDLDSLKNLQYFANDKQKGKSGDLMILNEKDIKLYHNDLLSLYRQKQGIERELFLAPDPFEVTQDFTTPVFTEENTSSDLISVNIKYFVFLGFFLILIWDQRKLVRRLLKEAKETK